MQSRFDERSARQSADKATRYYADASKTIGQQFSEGISAGLASSDAAVRKSAENAEKAHKKAADSAGQTRVEEAKLDDLRTKGAGATALLTQTERLEKAKRAEISTTREAITALHALDTAHVGAANSGSLLSGVLQGIAQGATGTRIGGIASAIEGIGTKGIIAAAGVGALVVGLGAVAKAMYDVGAQWDSIGDSLTVRTGKIGDDLKGLTDVVGDVGRVTGAPLGSIGDIVGQLQQSMPGLSENNTAIRDMASNLAYLDANGQAVNVRELGKAFSAFNINAADQVKTLDELQHVSQTTGIPINNLIQTVQNGAPQFKQFGLSMGESTGLMAAFEDGGLDAEGALAGLRIALKNLGSDARGPQKALADTVEQIKQLHDAGDEVGAQDLAKQVFGGKNFAPFLDAIESGRVNVEGLKKALDDTGLSVKNMQELTDDGAQGWTKLSNTIKTDLKPAADGIFGALNANVQILTGHFGEVIDSLTGVNSKLDDARDKLANMASVPITPDSALGKMLLPGGGLPGMSGTPAPDAAGSALGLSTLRPYSWGSNVIAPPGAGSKSLPGAPTVPYDTSLPSGFAGVPQTAEIVGAENSWMDARHTLAEKRARVQQLEGDNNATADDIQKAKNDVINAEQAQNQTELRLFDARTTLYNKENKALKDHTDALGEFGAKLDQDLGISKGLSGIADNLVRFLGNLIAAPELAKLNAIASAPGQAQGGFGLIGQLGAQGVFGPQYTAAGQAAASSTGTSSAPKAVLNPDGTVSTSAPAATSGYSGDAALLANVPAGRYTQDPSRDLLKGLSDCSSSVGDLVNIMDGQATTSGENLTTFNAAQWLPQHGFAPGMGGPGDFRVGYNSGHMQATLPGGTPWNWGSDSAAANRGIGGTGADDSAFTSHYYRPVAPAAAAPDGGGGGGGGGGPAGVLGIGGHIPGSGPGSWGVEKSASPYGPIGAQGSFFNPFDPNNVTGGGNITPAYKIDTSNASFGQPLSIGASQNGWYDDQVPLHDPVLGGGAQGPPHSRSWPPGDGSIAIGRSGQAPRIPQGGIGFVGGGPPLSPAMGLGAGPGAGGAATTGLGPPGPMAGGAAGTQIGAAVPPPSGTGKGGIGLTPGGSADTALNLAASAVPGLGQAAATGAKLASRAIQFAGQAAGIGAQGLMETFLPTGGSKLASNNWATKLIGGLAGAAPALPNMAGKPAAPPPPGQGQQGATTYGDTNINVKEDPNRGADGTGRDIAYHAQEAALPPGKP